MNMRVVVHRNHAAMCHFANRVFELNSRVNDPELLLQARPHVVQNPFAYRRRNIRDGNMRGERMCL